MPDGTRTAGLTRRSQTVWAGIVAWAPLALLAVFGALSIMRASTAQAGFGWLPGVRPIAARVLCADLPVFGVLAALLLGAVLTAGRWISRALLALVGAVLLGTAVDLAVFHFTADRLWWSHIGFYAREAKTSWHDLVLRSGGIVRAGGLLAVLALVPIAPAVLRLRRNRRLEWMLAALAVSTGLAGTLIRFSPTPFFDRYENLWTLNWHDGQARRYSAPAIARARELLARRETPPAADPPASERRDVILIVVESWADYLSKAFNGLHDWTPELDRLAQSHTRFLAFHATGRATNFGLCGALAEVRLWAPFDRLRSNPLDASVTEREELPRIFRQAGYRTAFLCSSDLGFTGKGAWLRAIGFEVVEGSEHPFYRGWPRGNFDAAGDEALFRRAAQWIAADAGARPWFLTLETISTHAPYLGGAQSPSPMERAFRFTDHWIGWFVRELERAGYFDHGILLVTGDHHPLANITPDEYRRFGMGAWSLVPLVLVDKKQPPGAVVTEVFGQADLVPSFQRWLGLGPGLSWTEGDLFHPDRARPNFALYTNGRVDVFTNGGEGIVVLDGDQGRFTSARRVPPAEQESILAFIADERLRREGPSIPGK